MRLNSSTDISSDTATRSDRLMAADVNASIAIQNKTAGRRSGKFFMFAIDIESQSFPM